MYKRYTQAKILSALEDTPAVIIIGPRQCGKTTLAKQLIDESWKYVTLDDINQLQFAVDDPMGFVRQLTARHIVIDEIQRAPELMLAIKQAIDEQRQAGRFLLTGSANAMALPKLSDSLAGRMEIIHLLPLAECEMMRNTSTFLSKIIAGKIPEAQLTRVRESLMKKILQGGFPEPVQRGNEQRRAAWFQQYLIGMIQKDLKDLASIEHLNVMPKLMQILANQVGTLISYTNIGNKLGLSRQTITRYLKLLEQLFIFQELPAWHGNHNKRLIKAPKMHIIDSGLLCALRRMNYEKISNEPMLLGGLLESYVLCELQRLASWFDEPLYFYHYRDKDKVEVDIVIETMSGDVIGIEVKASATVRKQDFQGLIRLKKAAGKHFRLGILLYDGDHTNALDETICSVPIGAIWS